jgi:hypothetical protein
MLYARIAITTVFAAALTASTFAQVKPAARSGKSSFSSRAA